MAKTSVFFLYHEDIEALRPLNNDQKAILFQALFDFSVRRESLKTEDAAVAVAFNLMSSKIARDAERYEAKCKRMQLNASGSKRKQKQADATNCLQMPAIAGKSGVTVTEAVNETVTVTGTVNNNTPKESVVVGCNSNVVAFRKNGLTTDSLPPFTPPMLEEVQDYCYQRGSSVDPLRFHTYYTARGWMMGKTPMTDWRSAIQWWEHRDEAENRKAPAEPDRGKYMDPDLGEIRWFENGKLVYEDPRLNKRNGTDAAVPNPAPYDDEPVHWLE